MSIPLSQNLFIHRTGVNTFIIHFCDFGSWSVESSSTRITKTRGREDFIPLNWVQLSCTLL